jgi:hypothetical protein
MPTLYGTFQGTHEALWSMKIEDHHWDEYMKYNPEFDFNDPEHIQDAWDYFKDELHYYDEPEESVDFENTLVGLEAYKDGELINETKSV